MLPLTPGRPAINRKSQTIPDKSCHIDVIRYHCGPKAGAQRFEYKIKFEYLIFSPTIILEDYMVFLIIPTETHINLIH